MKTKLLFLALLSTITIYSQTQIGSDIDGEAASDRSGSSVSLSSDGNILAIGARYNDGNGSDSGHVRVYRNMTGIWTQIGADIDGEAENDNLGGSVSLSSDGNILAIGGAGNSGNGTFSGHVRVYNNISDVWTQIGTDIDGEAASDRSGYGVSLSADGSKVAIGALFNDDNGINSGHVRVYENISAVWTQIGADIDGEATDDRSGSSVSLSSNGNILAIGANLNDGNINGSDSGHVRVYENISGVWTQIGADINGEAVGDNSGVCVSLSSDGNVVAIGANYNDGNGNWSGHVRVYENISAVWTQIGADINGEAPQDLSGWRVSLSSDGSILAIGALQNSGNGSDSGHVRIYQNLSGIWTQIGADIDGEAVEDASGWSVSLSSDGNTVAIGAEPNDGNGNNSGHVRVYDLSALLNLEDNEIGKNFTVYPNPVNNHLQLQLSTTLEFKKATIYNYYGQLVLQSKATTINVSNLSSGVYFLEIETNKGKGVKKIIKQ